MRCQGRDAMSEGDLQGRVAIVTGGAKGIGGAMVALFRREGAKVVIADMDEAAGAALASELGDDTLFLKTDVSSADDVQSLIDTTVARFGKLDVMVNNAAIPSAMHPRFLDEEFADFDKVARVNLLGVMLGTQRAGREMAKQGGGSIINVTSTSGLIAGFGVISYRVAKAGVVQLTRCAAIDLAEYGIRVNGIAPGNISTTINSFVPPSIPLERADDWRRHLASVRMANQPLKRSGTPDDVAQAALYLAGDRSAQVTGVTIAVDGGVTAGDPINHLQAIVSAQQSFAESGGLD